MSRTSGVDPAADPWFATNTYRSPSWTPDELVAYKDGRTISVVLPALDEEKTVGDVVRSIVPAVEAGLVDELIVLDSGSTDRTAELAAEAGARVVTREEALPDVPVRPGKGEVLWRSLAATSGDLIAFVDSDLVDPSPEFVPRLLGPLLIDRRVEFVKAYYLRPLSVGGVEQPHGGGRVTELAARPLLAAIYPELMAVIQPLGGEYAGTRRLLESLPFASGYGVEIGLLMDTYTRVGLEGIAQVDLGVRKHRNRPLHELGVMSRQIVATALRRCGLPDSGAGLTQFLPADGGGFHAVTTPVTSVDRPPMKTLGGGPGGRGTAGGR